MVCRPTAPPCGTRSSALSLSDRHPLFSWLGKTATPVLKAAAGLLLPRVCVACTKLLTNADTGLICNLCWSRLAHLPNPQCPRCGHPTQGRHSCYWCQILPPFVRAARSVCWTPHPSTTPILYALKYAHWPKAATEISIRMARLSWPPDVQKERALVVPVPLAQPRIRERGYNQSALLAQHLAAHWAIPAAEALTRIRATPSQTRLTPADRQRNVAGAFATTVPKTALAGKHVVLVDDVVTTAATLNSCAAALIKGGARIISYVTFGRARATGDRL